MGAVETNLSNALDKENINDYFSPINKSRLF